MRKRAMKRDETFTMLIMDFQTLVLHDAEYAMQGRSLTGCPGLTLRLTCMVSGMISGVFGDSGVQS